jgi:hypothetical protein
MLMLLIPATIYGRRNEFLNLHYNPITTCAGQCLRSSADLECLPSSKRAIFIPNHHICLLSTDVCMHSMLNPTLELALILKLLGDFLRLGI